MLATYAQKRVIIGLGNTGLSCARYFNRLQLPFTLIDSRLNPPQLSTFEQEFPDVPLYLGSFDPQLFQHITELIVSPGVNLNDTAIAKAIAKTHAMPIGDIELFAKNAQAPIIAITGTNAKGTVTTLVGDMIHASNYTAAVGGNIGKAALDLLTEPVPDFYVLEISSFQLETTYSLKPKLSTVLNISPDHLDRHKTLKNYIETKQHIYNHCEIAIWNRDDPNTLPSNKFKPKKILSFGLEKIKSASPEFGLQKSNKAIYLTYGKQLLIPIDRLYIKGQHNWANALAALTIGHAIQLPLDSMLEALCQFKGLPHRCQWIKEEKGVTWYNDSKATNVGATLAALHGLGPAISGKIVLIAGGLGKKADFSLLCDSAARYVKTAILIGQDAPLLKKALEKNTLTQYACDLSQAISLAQQAALPGDAVLLSPACASMDMFKNYGERGNRFIALVTGKNYYVQS
ncbi:MAG: UDP-N-acetylmuramoyl-L-alanine--D-glutamate ligase [Rickettsiella sp.]|nr:UDP-N-acetylmuramoyl-L-alanine--D-glutamate ligase [Rickettsiella sp.]